MASRGARNPRRDTDVWPSPSPVNDHENLDGVQPPRFTIDLSLPPQERYKEVATVFKERVQTLPSLFDEIVKDMRMSPRVTHGLARLCLRRVYATEETQELRGISQITGIQLYLLVAFNVLLDLFMGCTSGGVRSQEPGQDSRMLHFRTLDWGMDPLRRVIVHLDFVENGGSDIFASSITYAGYVGVLTGVREGLSMSLNFRPCHDSSTTFANLRFYFNHVMVLLGFRRSISSLLRLWLLSPKALDPTLGKSLRSVEQECPSIVTTAAYIILCDGDRTVVLEKDRASANAIVSDDFVAATNHDVADEGPAQKTPSAATNKGISLQVTGMDFLVEESIDRKEHICKLWNNTWRRRPLARSGKAGETKNIRRQDVIEWMNSYPTSNEETHLATIMDPKAGKVVWTQRYLECNRREMGDIASNIPRL